VNENKNNAQQWWSGAEEYWKKNKNNAANGRYIQKVMRVKGDVEIPV
jgi:hypothetical protein